MENWDTSEFESSSGSNEPPPKPPPSGNVFWYVAGALVLMLFLIVNSAPSYEVVIDPNTGRPAPLAPAVPIETPQVEAAPAVPTAEPEAVPVEPAPAEPVYPAHPVEPPVRPIRPPTDAPANPAGGSLSDMVAKLRPSVVYLFYTQGSGRFSGTGFVLDDHGHIATNAHVVAHTDSPSVMTHTGQSFPGRVIARSSHDDLAIVEADLPRDIHPVRLGDSDHIRIGDDILVMGFPLGLFSEVTVTPGIVSSIRREERLVQVSAPVNKGNSGGPVFSRSTGDVVAVVVAKHAVGEAIGFSIPVNRLKTLMEESGR